MRRKETQGAVHAIQDTQVHQSAVIVLKVTKWSMDGAVSIHYIYIQV